jgi:uncharacterized protein (TIGR00255 family)
MFKSMTAYGRSSLKVDVGHIVVEIQSVNRKHLEINVQLPKELALFDIEIKKWISGLVHRGSVSVKISAAFESKVPFLVLPNLPLAKQMKKAWDEIAQHLQLNGDEFDLSLLAAVPDILILEENYEYEDLYRHHLKESVEGALKGFMQMKIKEGNILQADINSRLIKIHKTMQLIEERVPYATQKYRDKLIARLEEVLPGHIENEDRILREIAVYAEKIDITEEIIRFFCHLTRFEELMLSDTQTVGKTLEFILQELSREINTIGSKSLDIDIARYVIDIKSELERIREQIQNIE